MPRGLRVYHPEHAVTWWDRVYDFFSGAGPNRREEGVDYSLVHRTSARSAAALLDGILSMTLLGDEMVRVDSTWRMPEQGGREAAAELVGRLRFVQAQPGVLRVTVPIRWVEFLDAAHGVTLLMRLEERPALGCRNGLEANLAEDAGSAWTEVAIGGE